MKIKLSKSQWELVGKKAGWMKTAQQPQQQPQQPLFNQQERQQLNQLKSQYKELSVNNDVCTYELKAETNRTNEFNSMGVLTLSVSLSTNGTQRVFSLDGSIKYNDGTPQKQETATKKINEWYGTFNEAYTAFLRNIQEMQQAQSKAQSKY